MGQRMVLRVPVSRALGLRAARALWLPRRRRLTLGWEALAAVGVGVAAQPRTLKQLSGCEPSEWVVSQQG